MAIDLCTVCRDLADQCECVRKEARYIASGRSSDPDDIGSLLYAMADLKEAVKEAEEPLRKHCKGASR